jgi:hypothetical protein
LLLSPKKKVRRQLKNDGRAKGRVSFTFTPSFGSPSTDGVPVTLKRKR